MSALFIITYNLVYTVYSKLTSMCHYYSSYYDNECSNWINRHYIIAFLFIHCIIERLDRGQIFIKTPNPKYRLYWCLH